MVWRTARPWEPADCSEAAVASVGGKKTCLVFWEVGRSGGLVKVIRDSLAMRDLYCKNCAPEGRLRFNNTCSATLRQKCSVTLECSESPPALSTEVLGASL